jgi:hypothetical protein
MPAESRLASSSLRVLVSGAAIPLRRRAMRFTLALAFAATLAMSGGTAVSPASTGSVYFDANSNVGAGENIFNGTFTGFSNVGIERLVMPNLTSGSYNTAAGHGALVSDTSGNSNTAAGFQALNLNTTGLANTAVGVHALLNNTAGNSNVALGSTFNGSFFTAAGENLTTGSNNIDIANPGVAGESGKIRIGTKGKQTAAFLAGVSGASIAGPVKTVVVNASGRLGTAVAAASPQSARATSPLSAAAGRRLLAMVQRQQREIRQLRKEVRRHR